MSSRGTTECYFLGPQGKDLLLQLEDETLKLVEPQNQALLHAQPIVSIRVWGVGRDSGRWEQGLYPRVGDPPAASVGSFFLTLLFPSLCCRTQREVQCLFTLVLSPLTPGPETPDLPCSALSLLARCFHHHSSDPQHARPPVLSQRLPHRTPSQWQKLPRIYEGWEGVLWDDTLGSPGRH